jgi:FAD/FMN-containing dehydrogenase
MRTNLCRNTNQSPKLADMAGSLSQALTSLVSTITDPEVISSYTSDWTGRFTGHADVVIRPESIEQVVASVRACTSTGAKIQIQGGNTGLVGGSVPPTESEHEICLVSTKSLTAILCFDEISGYITVGAGATLSQVQELVRAKGWDFAVDLAARDSATIGGLVATNAGGIRVCAFGMTRRSVVGIEMVLADGQVLSNLSSPLKDNTGYPVVDIAIGAEGTLGIITAVKLKLIRPVAETTLYLIPARSMNEALEMLTKVQGSGHQLLAAEYVDALTMQLILEHANLRPLWKEIPKVTLLFEVAGKNMDLYFPHDALGSSEIVEKRNYWQYREVASDTWTALGKVHKLDVSVAVSDVAEFESSLHNLLSTFKGVETFGSFGHLADGNLHIEVVGPAIDDFAVDYAVLKLVAEFNGSISAEHGIGRAKREYLSLTRPALDIEIGKQIRSIFDPTGLFNPGVLYAD